MPNVNFATGGTGPYITQIGWFNFGLVNFFDNTPLNFTNLFPNVGNISLSAYRTNMVSTSTGAPGGVLFSSGYTGVGGFPSIYFNQNIDDVGQVNIDNISVTDFSGNPLKFYLVTGDSETTIVAGEFLQWVTNGTPWYNLTTLPLGATPPYQSVLSGFGTTTFANTYVGGETAISPVLLTQTPTQIQFSGLPNARQGAGFGFIIDGLGATKSVSKTLSHPGDILTYTIPITAYGLATISNIILTDTLPTGITFNSGSLTINGVTVPSQSLPTITLPDLPVGSTATVSFKVTVNQNPLQNPIVNNAIAQGISGATPGVSTTTPVSVITNDVVTTIVSANLSSTKSVLPGFATVGTTLTYSILLENTGALTANRIVFIDTLPGCTSLIAGTFKQDTTTIPGNPNPPGVTLPNAIAPNSTSSVTFQVLVTTIPSINPIPNIAFSTYTYTVSSGDFGSGNTNSNTVNVTFNQANLVGVTKFVDKSFATCGDIITYTISIPNTGNITAINVILNDTVPNGTVFVSNSILVNGSNVSATPSSIPLGSIAAGATTTVSFKVKVQC